MRQLTNPNVSTHSTEARHSSLRHETENEVCIAAAELGRTSKARHGLFLAISKALVEAGARYTLPPYEMMHENLMHAQRPYGEGQAYMPPFMTKTALRL